MRNDRERLWHMIESIERIEKYKARGEDAFREDELIQIWMIYHVQTVGEAARAVSSTFREQHPGLPWASMIGMRHVLIHEYFGIDLDIVWRVVDTELPKLKQQIEAILKNLE